VAAYAALLLTMVLTLLGVYLLGHYLPQVYNSLPTTQNTNRVPLRQNCWNYWVL